MGDMADWINQGDPDEFHEEREVRCKHCGERGLYWEERGRERFILVDEDGNAHAPHCKAKVASPSEFPDLGGEP